MDLTGTFDDVVSLFFDNHDKNNQSNWWYMSCKINCLSGKTENLIKETNQSFLCVKCGEEQQFDYFELLIVHLWTRVSLYHSSSAQLGFGCFSQSTEQKAKLLYPEMNTQL